MLDANIEHPSITRTDTIWLEIVLNWRENPLSSFDHIVKYIIA
jgi:hypothetical protein